MIRQWREKVGKTDPFLWAITQQAAFQYNTQKKVLSFSLSFVFVLCVFPPFFFLIFNFLRCANVLVSVH